jgi:hypothetical protein
LPDVDHRSDVWSFCAILGELVLGHLPYEALPPQHQPWRPNDYGGLRASLGATAGPELAAIIQRGLSFDPAARFGDMDELGGELARWLSVRGFKEDVSGRSLESNFPAARSSRTGTSLGIAIPSFPPLPVGTSYYETDSAEFALPRKSAISVYLGAALIVALVLALFVSLWISLSGQAGSGATEVGGSPCRASLH